MEIWNGWWIEMIERMEGLRCDNTVLRQPSARKALPPMTTLTEARFVAELRAPPGPGKGKKKKGKGKK